MAGLFSFGDDLSDPRAMGLLGMATGLLQAGAASPRPINMGEALGMGLQGAMSGYNAGKGMQMEDQRAKLMNQQMETQALQAKKIDAQMQRSNNLQNMVMSRLGFATPGTQQAPGSAQVSPVTTSQAEPFPVDGPVPAAPLQAPQPGMQSPQGGKFPFSLNDLAALKVMGGPDLLDIFKYATDGSKRESGSYYVNPMTGQTQYMPKLPEGTTMTTGGAVMPLPGAAQANAAFKGAETGATEAAKARYDFMDVLDPSSGNMVRVPKSQFAGGAGGLGSAPIARRKPEDEVYANENAKAVAEQYKNLQSAGMKAPGLIAKYQQLEGLLGNHDGGKLSAKGLEIAQLANSMGFKIDKNLSNKEASQIITNELALAMRDPSSGGGMPGAMSDDDRNFLVSSVPNLSQSADGRRQMIKMLSATQQRNVDVAAMARKWQQRYGRLDTANPSTGKSFYDNLSDWSNSNPLFSGK